MKTTWKFQITKDVLMPRGAEICHFDFQNSVPCIWAIVDSEQPLENHRFEIYGTGHEIPLDEDAYYVGTAQDPPFVWHLWEFIG